MINVPTVLILGAGASHPYGLPLGRDLSDQIIVNTTPGAELRKTLAMLAFPDDKVDEFSNAFLRSGAQSIDAFLARRQEFTPLGKLIIAAIVMASETTDQLWGRPLGSDDWYPYLWQQLGDVPLEP